MQAGGVSFELVAISPKMILCLGRNKKGEAEEVFVWRGMITHSMKSFGLHFESRIWIFLPCLISKEIGDCCFHDFFIFFLFCFI